jgi:hypothetical protein
MSRETSTAELTYAVPGVSSSDSSVRAAIADAGHDIAA